MPRSDSRLVFIDVDGTLLDHLGHVPDSAVEAVRRARAEGHRVVVCTGRTRSELPPSVIEIGFDGYITDSGAVVEYDGQLVWETSMSMPQVERAFSYFTGLGAGLYFQTGGGLFMLAHDKARLLGIVERETGGALRHTHIVEVIFGQANVFSDVHELVGVALTKATYFDSHLSIDQVRGELPQDFDVVPASVSFIGPGSGELLMAGVHKATGIARLLDHLGVDRRNTIALGDSYNDLEMLEYVELGIAMGGAPDEVRAVADDLTDTPEADGVALALRRHGLVG